MSLEPISGNTRQLRNSFLDPTDFEKSPPYLIYRQLVSEAGGEIRDEQHRPTPGKCATFISAHPPPSHLQAASSTGILWRSLHCQVRWWWRWTAILEAGTQLRLYEVQRALHASVTQRLRAAATQGLEMEVMKLRKCLLVYSRPDGIDNSEALHKKRTMQAFLREAKLFMSIYTVILTFSLLN